MALQYLPIGIHNFEKIRKDGFLYVGKYLFVSSLKACVD